MSRANSAVKYRYEALDEDGERTKGVEVATSISAAHQALIGRGLQPIGVSKPRSILKFEITKKKVPRKDVMNFSRQLAVFMKAGIPIMEALDVIEDETSEKILKAILKDVLEGLRGGDTFAAAAAMHPEAFPNYYVGILESAELTGNLDNVLNQLADYIERDTKARTKIKAAMIYPAVVACMSVVTVGILALFVLPRFVVFFNSFHAKLPLPTRMILGFSGFLTQWWFVIIAVVIGLATGFILTRRSVGGKARLDALLLRMPVVGDLTQTAILERICRILSSLLKAGVDLPRSMAVTSDSANNAVYRKALEGVREEMLEGQGLFGPITRTGLFPGAAQQMFRVGEETGTLDQQLEIAADYYARELETKVDKVTALFEPLIIIFMGLIVGFVAVALVTAMYGIYSQVKV
ncbi:MAG TPA: type II secretion system F family protein [Acidimicrobiales bacterium]|nr:type II secretion system F family protein [Acidimicrobiales bacterium]HVB52562.1 type II secretion system F family protein [Acidimicrobiales bacterium]